MGKTETEPRRVANRIRKELRKQNALAIIPKCNAPNRRDVTGAFRPEAKKACFMFGKSRLIEFDNRQPFGARRREVLQKMRKFAEDEVHFDVVMFFCHGWSTGIQAGFNRSNVRVLAKAIRSVAPRDDVRVPLYCCSTGDDVDDRSTEAPGTGDDSFADRLRDAFCTIGAVHCFVMGHDAAGHTTKNPHTLRFSGAGSKYGGIGGFKLVTPGSALWSKWRRSLRSDKDFRYRFPHMSILNIHNELSGG